MKDQRAVQAFAGAAQDYGMELERRVSAAQDSVTTNAAAIAALVEDVAALSFALNTAAASVTSNMTTTSSSFVDMFVGTSVTLTTTGGDVLVLISGGGLYNSTNTEHCYIAISADGTDEVICHMRQNAATAGDLDNTEHPWGGFLYVSAPAAGAHTYKLRIRTSSGGQAEIRTGSRTAILAVEIPR